MKNYINPMTTVMTINAVSYICETSSVYSPYVTGDAISGGDSGLGGRDIY